MFAVFIPLVQPQRLQKDEAQIEPIALTVAAGGRLTFLRASRADAGAYLCIASNNVPPVVSRRIRLNVMCQ
jgi:hypothetical protein